MRHPGRMGFSLCSFFQGVELGGLPSSIETHMIPYGCGLKLLQKLGSSSLHRLHPTRNEPSTVGSEAKARRCVLLLQQGLQVPVLRSPSGAIKAVLKEPKSTKLATSPRRGANKGGPTCHVMSAFLILPALGHPLGHPAIQYDPKRWPRMVTW